MKTITIKERLDELETKLNRIEKALDNLSADIDHQEGILYMATLAPDKLTKYRMEKEGLKATYKDLQKDWHRFNDMLVENETARH